MRPINCYIPIRLRITGELSEARVDELRGALARVLTKVLAQARDVLAAHAPPRGAVFHPLTLRWTEVAAASVSSSLRRAVEAAVQGAVAKYIPPSGKPPARRRVAAKVPAAVPWRVRITARFHITPRRFFDIAERLRTRPEDVDLRELYFPMLDARRPAVAWVVEALREYEVYALADEVTQRFAATRSPDEMVWPIFGWREMRQWVAQADEDGVVAGQIPEFEVTGYSEVRPAPAGAGSQRILRPGAWLLLAFLPLPRMRLKDFVEIREPKWIDVPLRAVAGLVPAQVFAAELGMSWTQAEQAAADSIVTVGAEPFTVHRRIHAGTLASLFEQRRQEQLGIARLGRNVSLADEALAALPPVLQPFLRALVTGGPRPLSPEADWWRPGSEGASLAPFFEADLQTRVLAALNAPMLQAAADEVQRVLTLENTFWTANRTNALGAFIDRWRDVDARIFELLLGELERRGTLDGFLEAVGELSWLDTDRQRTVIALAVRTRYATHPRIVALVRRLERRSQALHRFIYRVEDQEIWLDEAGTQRVRAAGTNTDHRAGVVAEVEPYWSEAHRVNLPGPELLDRLREPTRKKIGALMARMICARGETMSREQLMQQAMQEAAKELSPPLEEKDFVRVTLRLSVRVLKLERLVVEGLERIEVHYQEVRKIGDEPWESVGEPQVRSALDFEGRLLVYHVEHLESALTTFALFQTVVYSGAFLIAVEVATLGTLVLFVSIQVLMYRFTTDEEDRTLDGYLTAALRGELDAVGFKLLSGVAKGAGQLVAGRLLTSELVSETATKWIVFTLRGTVTATGVGVMEVTYQFGEDLMRFSRCQGWSNPETYWNRFKWGFVITLGMEFVAIPLLAPPLRLALERASTAVEAARALRASGHTFREITALILEGAEKVEAALGRTIDVPAVVEPLKRSFRQRVVAVLEALAREYESRAYLSLLELYGPELGTGAARGLRRLLTVASEGEIDRLIQTLLTRKVSVSNLFLALGGADDALVRNLLRAGQLPELAASPRLLAVLTGNPAAGSRLLTGPFSSQAADLERYLARLENLPADARASVLGALLRERPLPPDLLLAAAREVGVLDEPTLALLRQLQDAGIEVSELFSGRGPSLRAFAEEFSRFTDAERAAALQRAGGRSPADVLAGARLARREAEAAARPAGGPPEIAPVRPSEDVTRQIEQWIDEALEGTPPPESGPLNPAEFAPPQRPVVHRLEDVDLSDLSALRRAEYEARHPQYLIEAQAEIQAGTRRPGNILTSREDYVRARHGYSTQQLRRGESLIPQDLSRPGAIERGAGYVLEGVVDQRLPPGSANNREFPNPWGKPAIPDHLPPGSQVVRIDAAGRRSATGTPFSARFVGDSKYRDFVPVTGQTRGFVNLARFSDEGMLVFYVRWQGTFPAAETLAFDVVHGGRMLPVRPWNERLVSPTLRDFARARRVRIRLVSDPQWR